MIGTLAAFSIGVAVGWFRPRALRSIGEAILRRVRRSK